MHGLSDSGIERTKMLHKLQLLVDFFCVCIFVYFVIHIG